MSENSIEMEYKEICRKNAWLLTYQKINRASQQRYSFTCDEARRPHNKGLNRYRDVSPFDHSRVWLHRGPIDYINANLVKIPSADRQYILTQGPLPRTLSHFWLMVWEQNSHGILMLNKIIEKNDIKCHVYWPESVGTDYKLTFSDVRLTVEQIAEDDFHYYSTRTFRVGDLDSNEYRNVVQFHYTTWPDFGVPSSPNAFLDFLTKVRSSGVLESNVGPAIVHCSAGIGRSGTFCLVDSCLILASIMFVAFPKYLWCVVYTCIYLAARIEKMGPESVNIQEILLEMRKDRMGLIQTAEQLRFSYLAVIEGSKRLLPGWVPDEVDLEDTLDHEEAPPLPPPRTESLPVISVSPARSLPPLPSEDSDEESRPDSPVSECSSISEAAINKILDEAYRNGGKLRKQTETDQQSHEFHAPERPLPKLPLTDSEESEVEIETTNLRGVTPDTGDVLRQRRKKLAERVEGMKRKQRDTDKWNTWKRSLYKPLAISFGVFVCGIVIYVYVKHND